MGKKIKIVEVGPRDGLQNEKSPLSLTTRYQLVKKLADAGLKNIEVGAFVSPKWVPQMAGSGRLVKKVFDKQKQGQLPKDLNFSALVPNPRGMEDALKTPIKEVAIFGACSESFSRKNINCSIDESFDRFAEVLKMARQNKIRVRGYLSTAFGCPYEGNVSQTRVVKLVSRMLDLGVFEVSLGDTIGVATPKQVNDLLKRLNRAVVLNKIAMHFHDTRGTALANVYASLQFGIRSFDTSVGGLGGCPYAKGASGNQATEDLAYMLEGMGDSTGLDINKLVSMRQWLEKRVGHSLPSHVGQAGLPLGWK